MSDYMLLEYLRSQGLEGSEHEVLDEFKQYMRHKGKKDTLRDMKHHKDYHYDDIEYSRHDWDMSDYEEEPKSKKYVKEYKTTEHIDKHEAKELVSEMYHYNMNRKHIGEHFDMAKAEEVCAKHKSEFVYKASVEDVYVAINATYHDFCCLFKSWFGPNIDEKIIMLAITFWFKDEDYEGNKVVHYFE